MKINYFVRTECHLTKSIVSFSLKGSDVILIWNEKYIERTVTWEKSLCLQEFIYGIVFGQQICLHFLP